MGFNRPKMDSNKMIRVTTTNYDSEAYIQYNKRTKKIMLLKNAQRMTHATRSKRAFC